MSTGNILSMEPFAGGVQVTFRVHGVEGERMYAYYGTDALAILGGADPAGYVGERDGGPAGGSGEIGADIADAILDIGELGAL